MFIKTDKLSINITIQSKLLNGLMHFDWSMLNRGSMEGIFFSIPQQKVNALIYLVKC